MSSFKNYRAKRATEKTIKPSRCDSKVDFFFLLLSDLSFAFAELCHSYFVVDRCARCRRIHHTKYNLTLIPFININLLPSTVFRLVLCVFVAIFVHEAWPPSPMYGISNLKCLFYTRRLLYADLPTYWFFPHRIDLIVMPCETPRLPIVQTMSKEIFSLLVHNNNLKFVEKKTDSMKRWGEWETVNVKVVSFTTLCAVRPQPHWLAAIITAAIDAKLLFAIFLT